MLAYAGEQLLRRVGDNSTVHYTVEKEWCVCGVIKAVEEFTKADHGVVIESCAPAEMHRAHCGGAVRAAQIDISSPAAGKASQRDSEVFVFIAFGEV